MLVLKFNYMQMAYDLCDTLVKGVDEAIQHFLSDAKQHLESEDQELQQVVFDMAANQITAAAVFYAHSILESYGTGSKMDITNEALENYIHDKTWWNPDRSRFAIAGRRKGSYINIFGESVESKGRFRGREIENMISPRKPSFGIQNAEKKLNAGLQENGYVMRILRGYANEFFESLNTSKYFYNEEV